MDSRNSRIRIAVGIAALAFPLAACGTAANSAGEFRPAGIPSAEPSPATPEALATDSPAARSVLSQYRRFHSVFEEALATNDPQYIPQVATGLVAEHLTETVRQQARRGVVRRGHDAVNPRIALLRQDTALVVDCVVTGGLWTYRVETGARVDAAPGPTSTPTHSKFRAVMTLDGGVWKVSQTSIPADSQC
jgi:hypothetical protein